MWPYLLKLRIYILYDQTVLLLVIFPTDMCVHAQEAFARLFNIICRKHKLVIRQFTNARTHPFPKMPAITTPATTNLHNITKQKLRTLSTVFSFQPKSLDI